MLAFFIIIIMQHHNTSGTYEVSTFERSVWLGYERNLTGGILKIMFNLSICVLKHTSSVGWL
jgi:hypothetical protein